MFTISLAGIEVFKEELIINGTHGIRLKGDSFITDEPEISLRAGKVAIGTDDLNTGHDILLEANGLHFRQSYLYGIK